MNFTNFMGEVFFFAIFSTPVIAFLVVRKMDVTITAKIILGVLIALLLMALFFLISFSILLRDGLGPG